ncbi:MAG: AVAST type 1 anti-phage system protein Avs1c [Syntrophales bacterium]|nr:AVAST type 1 anti-phage system protein Avs1c [Syntrophales bacterium]
MIETMQTPMTRAEFERRFHLLREQIHKGKFFIARGLTVGIEKIRFLPNGRIDFLSVNESARLQANMMVQFQSEEFKEKLKTRGPKDSSPEPTEDEPKE